MSLVKVLEDIKKLKPRAEENLEDSPLETLGAKRGRKKSAQESLKMLREQYISELLRGAVFIVTTGNARDTFATVARDEFNCFNADPEEFYQDLADRISPSLYQGKETLGNLFDVLGRYLEDKAGEMHMIEYPQVVFKQQYRRVIRDKADFVTLVKQIINEQVGAEVVGIQAVRSIVDEAIERGHSKKNTPIILSTNDESLVNHLLDSLERLVPRVFLVVAGRGSRTLRSLPGTIVVKEPTKETVEEALTVMDKSLKR